MVATTFRIIVSGWLVAVALWDRVEQRIPNALVLPALGAVLVWRIYQAIRGGTLDPRMGASLAGMLVAWGVVLGLWRLHVSGGGDAKLLMVQFGLFPTSEFALLLAFVVVACGLPRILARLGRANTPALCSQRHPDAWMPALAGLLYVWWLY